MSEFVKRERFGRYLILDHLVDGGMAKICRALQLGEQVEKVVAIKMVQPQYSNDEAFKVMFLDELKVTFPLLHPNIIQTYDYGLNKGQLFVAMEYCDGRNLKEFLEKLKIQKTVFTIDISVYIISQACQGLHYAHTFTDKLTGQEANIIHRDISPHNIMLSYGGSVKVIDFGIAKSQNNSEATQAGTIKGKLSYLAPEYLEGIELDARYDQFALGITLWEMLCSQKLFKDSSDLAVLKKIQECKIPLPSSINHRVPKELDEIVLKALSKDRTKRFENLDQMNRALMKFLYASFPDFNATDLSYFSQDLFRDEIKKDYEKMFEYGKIDLRPYLKDLKNEQEGGTKDFDESADYPRDGSGNKLKEKEHVLDFGFEKQKSKVKSYSIIGKKNSPDLAANKSNIHNISSKNISDENTISDNVSEALVSVKKNQTKIIKFETVELPKENEGSYSRFFAAIIALIIGYGGYRYVFLKNSLNEEKVVNKIIKEPISTERRPAVAETGGSDLNQEKATLVLTHYYKQKMQVFIDGKKVELDLLSSIKVDTKKDFTLRVQIEGKKHFVKDMRFDNAGAMEVEIPEMPWVPYGYVNTTSSCASGEIRYTIFGEKRVSLIPMNDTFGIAFPLGVTGEGQLVPQSFSLFFKKDGEANERKVEINMQREDQTIDLCELL